MSNSANQYATKVILWMGGIALAVAAFLYIHHASRAQVSVRVVQVSHQNLSKTVSTNGKVEPLDEFQAHAPGPGVIQQIYVEVGQHVSPGTPLVKLDDADASARIAAAKATLAAAEQSLADIGAGGSSEERSRFTADISSARAERQSAAANVASLQALQAKGAASAGEVASAQQRLSNAELTLKAAQDRAGARYAAEDRTSAQARVAESRAALASAQSSYANANIRSPISGTVYSVPFSQYDFVPSGSDDLVDVADLNKLQVLAYFDEPEIGKLAKGQPVKIIWEAKPDSVWHGHIIQAPTTVIAYGSTRSVGECFIMVDDPTRDLLPNTNVTVTVTETQRPDVLSIPREALRTEGTNDYVFRIVDHKLVRTPVQIGVVSQTSVEILGGLHDGDSVVRTSTDGSELVSGLEVKQVP